MNNVSVSLPCLTLQKLFLQHLFPSHSLFTKSWCFRSLALNLELTSESDLFYSHRHRIAYPDLNCNFFRRPGGMTTCLFVEVIKHLTPKRRLNGNKKWLYLSDVSPIIALPHCYAYSLTHIEWWDLNDATLADNTSLITQYYNIFRLKFGHFEAGVWSRFWNWKLAL